MKWLFVYPVCPAPIGGLKQIRLIASLFRERGSDAQLLIDYRDLPTTTDDAKYYDVSVPTFPLPFPQAGSSLTAEDVVVFPEHHLDRYLDETANWPCRFGVFNQNGFGALVTRPSPRVVRRRIEFVMGVSPYTLSLSHYFFGIPWDRLFLVPPWVVRGPFEWDGEIVVPRELGICYMPRKMPDAIERVRGRLMESEPSVPWVPIDGLPESAVASILHRHSIFFSTQNREGFGLPAVEAMACGCLPVGYSGCFPFPPPYATDENGLWARERSVNSAIQRLRQGIEIVREGGPRYSALLACGRTTANAYSKPAIVAAVDAVADAVTRGHYLKNVPHARFGLQAYLASLYILARKQRLQLGDLVQSPF